MNLSERPVECLAIGLTGTIGLPDLQQVEPPWTDLAAFGILASAKHTRGLANSGQPSLHPNKEVNHDQKNVTRTACLYRGRFHWGRDYGTESDDQARALPFYG